MAITKRKASESNGVVPPSGKIDTMPIDAPRSTPPAEVPAPSMPSAIVDRPLSAALSPAPVAGLSVPSTKSAVQVLSDELLDLLLNDDGAACSLKTWYGAREIVSTWTEPSADERKAMIRALINERGIDPTEDFEAVVQAKVDVDNKIAEQRNNSGTVKQEAIDRLRLEAAYTAFTNAATVARLALEKKGGKIHKISSSTSSTSKPRTVRGTRGRKSNWGKKNPMLIQWAKDHDMPNFVLVDKTDGGYKDEYHAIMALENGMWERVNFNSADNTYTRTGITVDRPVWFNDIDTGERVQGYAPQQMFYVLMFDTQNREITLPGVSIENRTGRGDMAAVYREIGLSK